MSTDVDVLDPRHDAEPAYWEELRSRAGQYDIWAWPLVRIAAWTSPEPLLIGVLVDGSRPLGAVCATLTGAGRRRYAPVARRARVGILDVHAPLAPTHPGWWFADVPEAPLRRALYRAYVRRMRREFGSACRGVLWRHALGEEIPLLPGHLRLTRPLNPVARLATPWPDVSGWYASLPAGRRKDLRRQQRRVADLTVRTGPAAEVVTALDVARLRDENDAKYRQRRTPLAVPYLDALIHREGTIAFEYRAGDRPLAVCLLLDHPHWPLPHVWGALPEERGGRPHLYFDLYARLVGWAVRSGRDGLLLGKGQTAVKRDLGAELVANYAVAVAHL